MDTKFLKKEVLEKNIKKLNDWLLNHNESHHMFHDYKKESLMWIEALEECKKLKLNGVEFTPKTQFVNYL